jgi:hypothetical protein
MKRFWVVDNVPRTSDVDTEVDSGREVSELEFNFLVDKLKQDGAAFLRMVEDQAAQDLVMQNKKRKAKRAALLKKLGLTEKELEDLDD